MYHTDYPNYVHEIKRRILAKCIPNANGCLEYRGGKLKHKYGLTSITLLGVRQSVPVSRAIYMATNDCLSMDSAIQVLHKCDNPPCCNIDHLFAGTSQDNAHDMISKGRKVKKHKLHTRHRIVSDETIRAIRNEPDRIKHYYIAYKYGVSAGYVSKIRSMKAKTLV